MLIPLGLLLFICFFVYAMIHTRRKQRKSKARVFRDFADKNSLRYQHLPTACRTLMNSSTSLDLIPDNSSNSNTFSLFSLIK